MLNQYRQLFWVLDAACPPEPNSPLFPVTLTLTIPGGDGLVRIGAGATLGGRAITTIRPGDTVTVRSGGQVITLSGVTFCREDAAPVFVPVGNALPARARFQSAMASAAAEEYRLAPPAQRFAAGTWIDTPNGPCLAETLRAGDLVKTRDHGSQPLCQVVPRHGRTDAAAETSIRFAPGVLGNDAPLHLSADHRVVVTGWRAELLFGADEVLVAAGNLVDGDRIRPDATAVTDGVELHFDVPQIVCAGGVWAETADTRPRPLDPGTAMAAPAVRARPARPELTAREAVVLMAA